MGAPLMPPPAGYSDWLDVWQRSVGKKNVKCAHEICNRDATHGALATRAFSSDKTAYIYPACETCRRRTEMLYVDGPLVPVSDGKVVCIGHITLDKIQTPRQTVFQPGGTAFYFGHAMAALGADDFRLITSVAPSEMTSVEALRKGGTDVSVIPGKSTVYFENIYGEDSNNRIQHVLAKAEPFTLESLLPLTAGALKEGEKCIFHLGTLLADDFDHGVIKALSERGVVSVDAQGYLREVRGTDVVAVDWKEKEEALRYIDILKANEHEMEVLTGSSDPEEASRILAEMGVKEVVITLGSEGAVIRCGDKVVRIPAYTPRDVVDATGCGDTFMAGYLYKRSRGADIQESGCFAAAMCTLKLEHSGPFNGTPSDISAILTEK